MFRQNASPESTTVMRVSSPPWLCPITIMRRSAGSFPSGSSFATAFSSDCRRSDAE
jgi:hypothetical protein